MVPVSVPDLETLTVRSYVVSIDVLAIDVPPFPMCTHVEGPFTPGILDPDGTPFVESAAVERAVVTVADRRGLRVDSPGACRRRHERRGSEQSTGHIARGVEHW
jgi:hypothetical protein